MLPVSRFQNFLSDDLTMEVAQIEVEDGMFHKATSNKKWVHRTSEEYWDLNL